MLGAIIGDLAGSIYEYEQFKKTEEIIPKSKLISLDSFYSDDTILNIAILDAILNGGDYKKYLKAYGIKYLNYKPNYKPYFNSSFSPGFVKWINGDFIGESKGNGAMMRIAPVAYMFDTEKRIIENVKLATIPSHNSNEAIECATKIAQIIFLAREKYSKEDIIRKLNIKLNYEKFSTFNCTCYETINNCLYAVFTSSSFEESIFKIISYGGDTDTNACIVGSIAEAMYGIDKTLIDEAKEKIPSSFVKKIQFAYNIKNNLK